MTASTSRQLPLALPHRAALGREDFLVSPSNDRAVAWIDRWPDWPGGILALCGPKASGKTHLIEVWRARSGAALLPASALADNGWMEAGDNLAIDDLAPPLAEDSLFHLINWVRGRGRTLLLATATPPSRWAVALPDLQSRLNTIPLAEIAPPDDALLQAVMVKQFADRQLAVSPDVITYILRRIDRSFEAVRQTVEHLDRRALAEKRPLTVRFVRGILDDAFHPTRETS